MSKIDLLIVASDYKPKPGGRADYIDNLARGLISTGTSVRVLAVAPSRDKERLAFLEGYEKWVIPFPIVYDQRPRGLLGNKFVSLLEVLRCQSPRAQRLLDKTPFFTGSSDAVSRLEKVLATEQPRMAVFGHLDMRLYPFALYLIRHRIPYGIIAHESEVYPFPEKKNHFIRRGMMIRGAQWVAANSRHTKSIVEMWDIPSSRIKLVYPPISQDAIAAAQTGRGPDSRTDSDVLRIVTICRLVKPKGVDTVLHALSLLDTRGVPFRYAVGGDGPERNALEALATELGIAHRVNFLGYITDEEKWRILQESQVFVMLSRIDPKTQHEGFGIAFMEAAALGIPSIGSNQGGIPDAVLNGETGLLVSPDSPDHLADALIQLYKDPQKRAEMGRIGRSRAVTQFSPAAIAEQFRAEIASTS